MPTYVTWAKEVSLTLDSLEEASRQLERIKGLVGQLDLNYQDIRPSPLGVGIGIAWSETRFVVLSVPMTATLLFITSGVLRDIDKDPLSALTMCNARNQGTTAYPFFLHDADSGWDILVQQTHPIQLLFDVPQFFSACLRGVPDAAEEAQEEFLDGKIGGRPYHWNLEDLDRLLLRSLA